MNHPYTISTNTLTLEAFKYLCTSVGWAEHMNFEVAEKSIANTIFSVTIRTENELIGMGRIIGDGAIYYYVQDIVVHPDHQGKGAGKLILTALTDYLQKNAADKSFVGLFASEGNESFYEKFDYKNYSPHMTGMFRVIQQEKM